MRCAACHRTLTKPAYTSTGRYPFYLGPVCAIAAGMVKPKARQAVASIAVEVQEGQFDLFDAINNEGEGHAAN